MEKNMVYVILADGFEEIEALTPVDVLRRAGFDVKTVGLFGKIATGSHGIPVVCDLTADEAEITSESAELVIFPGGMPGAAHIDADARTDSYIAAALEGGGYVAAICAAPMILGKRGYLQGRGAVCYPGFEDTLLGAEVKDCDVVTDGKFITSKCMGTALPFALEIVERLRGAEERAALEATIRAEKD